jgi:hypothetical protein
MQVLQPLLIAIAASHSHRVPGMLLMQEIVLYSTIITQPRPLGKFPRIHKYSQVILRRTKFILAITWPSHNIYLDKILHQFMGCHNIQKLYIKDYTTSIFRIIKNT